ncbi:MAG: GIY-YIG nuclease family protein [Alphaproteobacteria bacterium]|nr:MAG: GIY-YIG nuclease family protein [Alphaproteobacteria bacterium]
MSSKSRPPATAISTDLSPFETAALREGLREFLNRPVKDPQAPKVKVLGGYKYGVYAFFDYDNEPIYVGQTHEKVSTRIRRHLTNQRTDAVAMNVLDPYEVYAIAVWPCPQFQQGKKGDPKIKEHMDTLEAAVFTQLVKHSKFGAVLNEKIPYSRRKAPVPKPIYGAIVSDEVKELRGHPDTRLARRAATIARLAQVINERKVQPGLRRTLKIQATRLLWLAEERYKPFEAQAIKEDAQKDGSGEDEE